MDANIDFSEMESPLYWKDFRLPLDNYANVYLSKN